jgi:hypothetical protein
MGFLDKLLGRAKNAAADHADDVKAGVDKTTDFVDDKTGGKLTGALDKVDDAADKAVDSVAGEPAEPSDTPPAG